MENSSLNIHGNILQNSVTSIKNDPQAASTEEESISRVAQEAFEKLPQQQSSSNSNQLDPKSFSNNNSISTLPKSHEISKIAQNIFGERKSDYEISSGTISSYHEQENVNFSQNSILSSQGSILSHQDSISEYDDRPGLKQDLPPSFYLNSCSRLLKNLKKENLPKEINDIIGEIETYCEENKNIDSSSQAQIISIQKELLEKVNFLIQQLEKIGKNSLQNKDHLQLRFKIISIQHFYEDAQEILEEQISKVDSSTLKEILIKQVSDKEQEYLKDFLEASLEKTEGNNRYFLDLIGLSKEELGDLTKALKAMESFSPTIKNIFVEILFDQIKSSSTRIDLIKIISKIPKPAITILDIKKKISFEGNFNGALKDIKHFINLEKLSSQNIDFTPPSETILEKTVHFSAKTFRERATTSPILFSDLPKKVKPDSLKKIFLKIKNYPEDNKREIIKSFTFLFKMNGESISEERLSQLSNDEMNEIINDLKESFLDSYIQSLLKVEKNGEEQVFSETYQFFAIADHILNQTDEGTPPTNQDQALLTMAASIQNCSKGKSEGISIAYHELRKEGKIPESYKNKSLKGHQKTKNPLENSKEIIDDIVQDSLMELFSGESPLIKEVTQQETVNELTHQCLYLKNLIASKVGLAHQIQFDQHSQVISPDLLKLEVKDALEIFYKHFTVEKLIEKLVSYCNNSLEEGNFDILNQFNLGLLNDIDVSEVWEEKDDSFILTKIGALKILSLAGFIEEEK